jgi:hypothetical protein
MPGTVQIAVRPNNSPAVLALTAPSTLDNIHAVQLDYGDRRGWNALDLALYVVGVAGLAAALTIIWLSMRAVLGVGGFCAEGGPYEIAQHCPDGVALLLPLSIFTGLGCAGLMAWKGAVLGGPYAGLVGLAWPALFISLGWNFLEFALFPPPPDTGVELGWLIPGVLFVIMGAVPLLGFLPSGNRRKPARDDNPFAEFAAEGEARYQHALDQQRSHLLTDLVAAAGHRAADSLPAPASPRSLSTENADVVSKLERLSALYRSGSLTYDEFQRAKAAAIGEAGG